MTCFQKPAWLDVTLQEQFFLRPRQRVLLAISAAVVLLLLVPACRQGQTVRSPQDHIEQQPLASTNLSVVPVQAALRSVDFHTGSGATLHIRKLRGEILPTEKNVPPTFDDPGSFVVRIRSGEIGITAGDLANLLNRYVFDYSGAPLRDIRISIQGDRLKQKGTLIKGVPIPFEAEGKLSPTPEGSLEFQVTKIKSAHLPVKGLMDLMGAKLADVINLNQSRGVQVKGDSIILFPARIIPPPRIEGRITHVRLEREEIVQVFGEPQEEQVGALAPSVETRNYMYFRGGSLRFGKLTMRDADLEIIDTNAADPLDFNLREYTRQLVAGHIKYTPSLGLLVFMPDFYRVAKEHQQASGTPRR
jgi:hypothetical protein